MTAFVLSTAMLVIALAFGGPHHGLMYISGLFMGWSLHKAWLRWEARENEQARLAKLFATMKGSDHE
jgi:hypothetical protein